MWNVAYSNRYPMDQKGPKQGCLKVLYYISEAVPRYVIIRTVIYLVICMLIVWCVFLGMVSSVLNCFIGSQLLTVCRWNARNITTTGFRTSCVSLILLVSETITIA